MSKAQDEISELLALQKEAGRKRSRKRKKPEEESPPPEPEVEEEPVAEASEEEEPTAPDDDAKPRSELEEKVGELSDLIESAVEDIEKAAKEQPVLVSLVAFTLGLVLGQSLSRR